MFDPNSYVSLLDDLVVGFFTRSFQPTQLSTSPVDLAYQPLADSSHVEDVSQQ